MRYSFFPFRTRLSRIFSTVNSSPSGSAMTWMQLIPVKKQKRSLKWFSVLPNVEIEKWFCLRRWARSECVIECGIFHLSRNLSFVGRYFSQLFARTKWLKRDYETAFCKPLLVHKHLHVRTSLVMVNVISSIPLKIALNHCTTISGTKRKSFTGWGAKIFTFLLVKTVIDL